MLRCKITPYEGTEPYIFISYAHKDSHLVFPILEELDRRGYRIWYDDGIAPGSEWPENIAQHLNGCSLTIAFISPNSIVSDNCRREVNFALSKQKAFLGVVLEPTEMSLGMEMQLSSQQCVMRYTYPSEEAFLNKVCSCPDLAPCRRGDTCTPAAPIPAAATAPAAPKAAAPKQRKLLPWIIGGCAALAAVAAILIFTLGGSKEASEPPQEPEAPAATEQQPEAVPEEIPEEAPVETMENPRQIILTGDDMTAEEFAASIAQVEQRVEILTGGNYTISVQDQTATVEFPHAAFCGLEESYVLRCYLSRAMELYAYHTESTSLGMPEFIHLQRSDLESVTLHEGHLPGVDTSKLNIETTDYQYLQITLTEACASKYQTQLSAWGKNIALAQDLETAFGSGMVASYFTYPSEDSRTFYVINADVDGPFSELMYHNLTHDPLASAFTFRVVDLFDWEDPADTETPGALQVAEDALTGNQVTLVYDYYDADASLPDLLKLEIAMKYRFDAMGSPYAYGKKLGQNASFVFKTSADRMSEDLARLLGYSSNSMAIASDLCKITSLGEYTLKVVEQKNGTFALHLQLDPEDWSDAAPILEQLTTFLTEDGSDKLYLTINGIRFATTEITEPVTDGFLLFTDCYLADLDTIDADHAYLYDLIPALTNKDNYMYNLDLSYVSFDADSPMLFGLPASATAQALQDAKTAIQAISPDANVFRNGSNLYVQLQLPVDDQLPEKGMALVQQIYEAVDLKESPFTMLLVAMTPESDTDGERCRVAFNKMANTLYSLSEEPITDGIITTSVIVQGARMDGYMDAFQAIVDSDPFYTAQGATLDGIW